MPVWCADETRFNCAKQRTPLERVRERRVYATCNETNLLISLKRRALLRSARGNNHAAMSSDFEDRVRRITYLTQNGALNSGACSPKLEFWNGIAISKRISDSRIWRWNAKDVYANQTSEIFSFKWDWNSFAKMLVKNLSRREIRKHY